MQLDDCISTLGGRLTDLEFLARRIKTGETPKSRYSSGRIPKTCSFLLISSSYLPKVATLTRRIEAVREITEQSASEILKMYILDSSPRKWTAPQVWIIIKSLASAGSLRYNELLLSDVFKSEGEATLQALEAAEMISIVSSNGRPTSIKPGKPVYAAAFRQLTEDHVLKAKMDLAILTELIKAETSGIDKYEAELNLLGNLPGQPREVQGRVRWLLGKLWCVHPLLGSFAAEESQLISTQDWTTESREI